MEGCSFLSECCRHTSCLDDWGEYVGRILWIPSYLTQSSACCSVQLLGYSFQCFHLPIGLWHLAFIYIKSISVECWITWLFSLYCHKAAVILYALTSRLSCLLSCQYEKLSVVAWIIHLIYKDFLDIPAQNRTTSLSVVLSWMCVAVPWALSSGDPIIWSHRHHSSG